jgi:LacI family transcriptional regulator
MAEPAARSSATHFVVVLLPEPEKILDDKSYYGPMLQGLNDALLERGFYMRPVACLHEYQRERFLSSHSGLYAGAVFLGPIFAFEDFIREVTRRVPGPKVLLDHRIEGLAAHSVQEDAEAGMRMLAEHLLGLGHRHLAYLEMSNPNANPWKRQGLNQALRDAGLEPLAHGRVAGCRDNFSDVSGALEWLLSLEPRPSAVLCADDIRALLLLQAAAERGLRVPQDLSITGFGDVAVRTGRSKMLTSVHFDPVQMGRKAAELIAGGPQAEPVSVLIPPELAVRGTAAALLRPPLRPA